MKTGTSPSNRPAMSARPPMRSSADVLKDLDSVSEITEAPSRAAAQALDGAGEGAQQEVKPYPVAAPESAAEAQAAPAKGKGKDKPVMPWDELVNSTASQQLNLRLPVALLAKLKFLGETTYGESQTSIVKKALEEKMARMLKERGLS